MRRLILTLLLALGSVATFAETSEKTRTSEEVLEILNGVCDKLQVPVEKVYTTFASVQRATVITEFITAIVLLAICVFTYFYLLPKTDDECDTRTALWIIWIISGIVGLVFMIIAVSNIPRFVNPEYGAIREILFILTK